MSRLVSRKQRIWSGLVCILRKFNNAVSCLPSSRSASNTALLSAVRTLSALCTVAVDSQHSLL